MLALYTIASASLYVVSGMFLHVLMQRNLVRLRARDVALAVVILLTWLGGIALQMAAYLSL